MEKFYIVTNEKFLEEIKKFYENAEKRNSLIKEFFEDKGIFGTSYHINGNGFVNKAFLDRDKDSIRLYICDSIENDKSFGSQLKKPTLFNDGSKMRCFKKNSLILKEFQRICVDRGIVINNHSVREGDYFKELEFSGYVVRRFIYNGNCYLRMETRSIEIIPKYDGFQEIKGSEFYSALEKIKEERNR